MKPVLDISEFQAGIDYAAVSQQISGVIIRCGGTGYGDSHTVYDDSKFEQHYNGFRSQGIPIGIYFYAGAVTDEGVDAEIQLTKVMLDGKDITLPVYYDVEVPEGNYLNLSVSERTRLALRYIHGMDDLGYMGGLYTYLAYTSRLNMDAFAGVPVWMAQYYTSLDYTDECELWQYTSTGTLNGYSGRVDLSEVLDEAWWYSIIGDAPDPETPADPAEKEVVEMKLPVLYIGMEGKAVESLQGILQSKGFDLEYCGGCDGIFGEGTEYAVRSYQLQNGLDVDGVVGEQTWSSFF